MDNPSLFIHVIKYASLIFIIKYMIETQTAECGNRCLKACGETKSRRNAFIRRVKAIKNSVGCRSAAGERVRVRCEKHHDTIRAMIEATVLEMGK